MTLHFMQYWPDGSSTFFVEKIIQSFPISDSEKLTLFDKYSEINPDADILEFQKAVPKLHTIRFLTDKRAEQWRKTNRTIHFKVWTGKPYVSETFNFFTGVVSKVERIQFYYPVENRMVYPYILNEKGVAFNIDKLIELVVNDGFYCTDKFFDYFTPELIESKRQEGKHPYIIHWTDIKY